MLRALVAGAELLATLETLPPGLALSSQCVKLLCEARGRFSRLMIRSNAQYALVLVGMLKFLLKASPVINLLDR